MKVPGAVDKHDSHSSTRGDEFENVEYTRYSGNQREAKPRKGRRRVRGRETSTWYLLTGESRKPSAGLSGLSLFIDREIMEIKALSQPATCLKKIILILST